MSLSFEVKVKGKLLLVGLEGVTNGFLLRAGYVCWFAYGEMTKKKELELVLVWNWEEEEWCFSSENAR